MQMKYRVQEFRSVQRGRTYKYLWLGYSYRNDKGTPTFKCLYNLTSLPEAVVQNIACLVLDGQVASQAGEVEFISSTYWREAVPSFCRTAWHCRCIALSAGTLQETGLSLVLTGLLRLSAFQKITV